MERHPVNPWKIRDRMLNEMGCFANGISWAEWKAAALNWIFQEQGVRKRSCHSGNHPTQRATKQL
jgi:hypothetical protein